MKTVIFMLFFCLNRRQNTVSRERRPPSPIRCELKEQVSAGLRLLSAVKLQKETSHSFMSPQEVWDGASGGSPAIYPQCNTLAEF